MRLKNKFETAVINEPSVFEPLKFNCILCLSPNYSNGSVKQLNDSGMEMVGVSMEMGGAEEGIRAGK